MTLSTNHSFVGRALPAAAFRIQETDSRFTSAQKFTAGRAANTLLAVAALLETFVFATLTVLSSPLYFIAPKSYSSITRHTYDSANAGKQALREVFGLIQEALAAEKPEKTSWEKIAQHVRSQVGKLEQNKGKALTLLFTSAALVILFNYRSAITASLLGKAPNLDTCKLPLLALPAPEDVIQFETTNALVLQPVSLESSPAAPSISIVAMKVLSTLAFGAKQVGKATLGLGAIAGIGTFLLSSLNE